MSSFNRRLTETEKFRAEMLIDWMDDYVDKKLDKGEISYIDLIYILEANRIAEKCEKYIDNGLPIV